MKRIITTICLGLTITACGSLNDTVTSNSSANDSEDASVSEHVSQTSEALTGFPAWSFLEGSKGCVTKGIINSGIPTLLGDENCRQQVTNYFQVSGVGQVKTWDQLCLDSTKVNFSNITNIVTCGTTPNENWTYFNRELTANTGCLQCDTLCVEAPCTGSPVDQLFTTEFSPPPYRPLTIAGYYPANPNLCLEPTHGLNTFAGDSVVSTTCDGTGFDQLWINNGGTIIWSLSNLCITATGNDATPVSLQTCTGSPFQQWTTMAPNALYNVGAARCLDIPAHALGTATLQTFDCNGGLNQQFNGPHN